MIEYYYADSLEAYFECIRAIENKVIEKGGKSKVSNCFTNEKPPVLWYRGLSHVSHALIPGLYRTGTYVEPGISEKYSRLHDAETVRTQHYIAKNYHFFEHKPSSRLEWLEVMQHHGMKTRVMDWSESSVHSLLFAAGAFLYLVDEITDPRRTSMPCVWVLEPGGMNRRIIEYLLTDNSLIEELISPLHLTEDEKIQLAEQLKHCVDAYSGTSCNVGAEDVSHLEHIVNLSAINDEYVRNLPVLKTLLLNGEVFPLIYYLLIKVYSEGHTLMKRVLPPLAVVNPYHSERIKAQKGVFTVFPFYKEQDRDKKLRDVKIEPNAMENNQIAQDYLYKIMLTRPQKIVEQMLVNGMDGGWLYPELPAMAKLLENHRVK